MALSWYNRQTMKKALPILLALSVALLLGAAFSGCAAPAPKKEEPKVEGPPKGHNITKKVENEILNQTREALSVIEGVENDASPLEQVLAKGALKEYRKALESDVKLGRQKVRRFSDEQLLFRNYTGGIAGIIVEFADKSYYIDAKTGERLGDAVDQQRRYIVSLEKIDGRWKITNFFKPVKDTTGATLPPKTGT